VSAQAATNWTDANQAALLEAFGRIRGLLESRASGDPAPADNTCREQPGTALSLLTAVFGLSPFERDLVTLCAGVEMDSSIASLCARAQGDSARIHPTWSLALATLPGAHWSALSPSAPLRRWGLVELGGSDSLVLRTLSLDERVLHYLAGLDHVDDSIAALARPIERPAALLPIHLDLAGRLAAAWSHPTAGAPVLVLCGAGPEIRQAIAAEAMDRTGLELWSMAADVLPGSPAELTTIARLWERESWLDRRTLLVECRDVVAADSTWTTVCRLAERISSPLILSGRELPFLAGRPCRMFSVETPTAAEQRAAWRSALAARASSDGLADRLASQFNLDASAIAEAVNEAGTADFDSDVWHACVGRARPRLSDLAERIAPGATWEDLVLPEVEVVTLRHIAAHGRRRALVQEEWGFAAGAKHGLGVSVLFEGDSGTGKTLAAEVIAHDLELDLYRVDLSQVVSKYIGETEKNLRRVFDAADAGGAVLLFDEADAIFGRRSEVRDSHDRYANIEVGYLLQRMEAFRGIAILTTNMRSALDPAFLRRLRFVVTFPFPDEQLRERIWSQVFPSSAPVCNLDTVALARLPVTGGSIRNIALLAAFLAADDGGLVTMRHLLAAARTEFQKLGRNLTTGLAVELQ
jgi:hypothetical protein